MRKSMIAIVLAVLLVACSKVDSPKPQPGELPAGIAAVTIADTNVAKATSVRCSPEGTVTTIETGTKDGGTTSTVDSSGGLTAKSVEIRNVSGFSGSNWQGLDGSVEVTMTGRTYLITGTAMGYSADNPTERKPEKFSIQVAC